MSNLFKKIQQFQQQHLKTVKQQVYNKIIFQFCEGTFERKDSNRFKREKSVDITKKSLQTVSCRDQQTQNESVVNQSQQVNITLISSIEEDQFQPKILDRNSQEQFLQSSINTKMRSRSIHNSMNSFTTQSYSDDKKVKNLSSLKKTLNFKNQTQNVKDMLQIEDLQERIKQFDSSSQRFPYMKKHHLYKLSEIQQTINEPDQPDYEENEKGTFTEMEFLNLKPYESSMLFTVLEETVIAQNTKIKRQKDKIAVIKNEKVQYYQAFQKVHLFNEQLCNNIQNIKDKINNIIQDNNLSDLIKLLESCKDTMLKSAKNTIECLAFYKDIVKINKECDSKQLKLKLDQYLKKEGSKLSLQVLNTDIYEKRLQDISSILEKYQANPRNLLRIIDKNLIDNQVDQQDYSKLLNDMNILENNMKEKETQNKEMQQYKIQQMKNKLKEYERQIEITKKIQNDYQLIKDNDNAKQLIVKLQSQNTQYKLQLKCNQLPIMNNFTNRKLSVQEQNTQIINKVKEVSTSVLKEAKMFVKNVKEILNKDIDYKSIQEQIIKLTYIKGRLTLILESFIKENDDSYFSDISSIKSQLVQLESKLQQQQHDKQNKYDSIQTKHIKYEQEKEKLTLQIAKQEDELMFLKKHALDENIQTTFEQISLILLQSSHDILSDSQKSLLTSLFGHQIQNVMETFSQKLYQLEIKNKDLLNKVVNTLKEKMECAHQSLSLNQDILKMINSKGIDNEYKMQKMMIMDQLRQIQDDINTYQKQMQIENNLALNEHQRRLSILNQFEDGIVYETNNTQKKKKQISGKLKNRICELEDKLQIMQLENMQLQIDIKNRQSITSKQNSAQKQRNTLRKSKSDQLQVVYTQKNQLNDCLILDSDEQLQINPLDSSSTPKRISKISQIMLTNQPVQQSIFEQEQINKNKCDDQLYGIIHSQALAIEEFMKNKNQDKLQICTIEL